MCKQWAGYRDKKLLGYRPMEKSPPCPKRNSPPSRSILIFSDFSDCLQYSGIPRSTKALAVGPLQQHGLHPLGLLQTGNVRGGLFRDTSVAFPSLFNVSLFPGLIRSSDTIGHLLMTRDAVVTDGEAKQ
jgi:hypothetical protein